MIKKLKFKFIIINMVLISAVLITAFTVMYFNAAANLENQSVDTLKEISEAMHFDEKDPGRPPKPNEPHRNYFSAITIEIHKDSGAVIVKGFSTAGELSDTEQQFVNHVIDSVNNNSNEIGVISEYNYRYYAKMLPHGLRITLLDKQHEDDYLNQLIISLVLSGGLAILCFLVISIILANIVVKPVEKSFKQQKQLISDVSHELKTPITVISTNADIIASHADSQVSEELKWIDYIKTESIRMTDLVNMMLYLAKSDEANEELSLDDINISNAVYESLLPFESVCFENKKELIIDIEPNLTVKCNEASIKQLLYILLDNALKYSDANGTIIARLKRGGDKVILSINNTGIPIPSESIPLIFDRFYRVDESRSREKGGSGLGLSIAKRIIENNKGSIEVHSDEAKGTTFTCTFDLIKKKKVNAKHADA